MLDSVLSVRDLKVCFASAEGPLTAINGVSFDVPRGRTLALVGESGCGKSVTAYSILRLVQSPGRIAGGSVVLHSKSGGSIDITALPERSRELRQLRGGRVSMIFQEPMTALSPVHTIGAQISEAIRLHRNVSPEEARKIGIEMLSRVGIPRAETRFDSYSFQFSGGMRQRVMIAIALACQPELVIADEPTTALDVTIQAQILALLRELQRDLGLSVLLITHDLGVVSQLADEVAVMYLGRVVEHGPVREVLTAPAHPYTAGLLACQPALCTESRLRTIPGSVPSLHEIPSGCAFHPRCEHAEAGTCDAGEAPSIRTLLEARRIACHLPLSEIRAASVNERSGVGSG